MLRIAKAASVGVLLLAAISISAATTPSDDRTITHVLNRVAFGPRPGDLDRVRAMGLTQYIEQQLHPERIADAAADARLAAYPTLTMNARDIAEQFEIPQIQARQAKKQAAAAQADEPDMKAPRAPDSQLQKGNRVLIELAEAKLVRAVYSERQLQEVLTDFWFNHFNVDARKGRDRFLLTEYERDAIRPRVLGKFRDLLEATAKSPAMLFYLDNWMSADPNGPHMDERARPFARRPFGGRVMPPPPQPQGKNARRGLNENYAREVMELHTLGVDGGYTQKDVTEVARAFTGWTIQNPRQGAAFRFEPRIHDPGEKMVLGHRIRAGGGEDDGEQVLDILAAHPSTAHFVATKLVRRFVSDTPPAALVDRAAARFRDTHGDLREVMRTILTSSELLSADAYRAKVKTPFEFVVSALRATAADVREAAPLVRAMQQLGMPLYMCQPPTGYKDTADAWVNTGALVNRMNFALALADGKVPGVAIASRDAIGGSAEEAVAALLGGDASESTRATIGKAANAPQLAAFTLGAPEFQRR